MELRDFAEQILFGTTLDEKLSSPGVFVFNPFAEGRIGYGRAFTPTKHQVALARDLANLPQFLCGQEDIVLVEKRPAVAFLSTLEQAGFALPEFVEMEANQLPPRHPLRQRQLGGLRPWAWGPDSVELLEPFFANVTGENRDVRQAFNEDIARLYSKAWSAAFLQTVLQAPMDLQEPAAPSQKRWMDEPWVCGEKEVGVAVSTLGHALKTIEAIRRRGHHKVVAKEAHGLAGQNSVRLWEPTLLEPQRCWMAHALENGRQLVIEPWLERELDFSVQLEMQPRGLRLCGCTGLINDLRGQFQANWATANYDRRIPAQVAAALDGPADICIRLHRLYEGVISLLELELQKTSYRGSVGIDAFVYRTPEGQHRLKPIVEINPRYTMGRVTVELMKHTCPGSHGLFRLVNRAMARAEGFGDFPAYARALNEQHPLRHQGEPVPKIREGVLVLNDPATAQACLAVFLVTRSSQPAFP